MLLFQRSLTVTNRRYSNSKRVPAISQPFSSLPALFRLCHDTKLLSQIHSRFIVHGLHQNPSLSSDLIRRYSDLSRIGLSIKVFDSIRNPDALLYHTILRNLAVSGEFEKSLDLYRQMSKKSLFPNESAYPFVIWACSCLSCLVAVHCNVVKLGFDGFCAVSSALLEMYCRCCEFASALRVFDTMPKRNLASWNAIISAVIEFGDNVESFRLFNRMIFQGIEPDSVTFVGLLRACVGLGSSEMGRLVHSMIVVNDLSRDLSVSTALLMMYCKLDGLEIAKLLFNSIEDKDCAVWNAMMSGYLKNGYPALALEMLAEMGKSGARADLFTAISSIASVAELKSLRFAKEIHGHVIRNGSDYQVSVHNSLIEMYFKCKCPEMAQKVFDSLRFKSAISFSSMIKGYIYNQHSSAALSIFAEMKMDGTIRPDGITLINVLPACVSSAALEQVQNIHGYSIKQGLNSSVPFITSLLVSYAKCGFIEMAQKLFDEEETDHRDLVSWNSMIGAYSKHGNWSRCFELYKQMKDLALKPDLLTFLGLLTACVNSGLVNEGKKCFDEMIDTYGYQPDQEHYACMVDLLGRYGELNDAKKLIDTMPFKPDVRVWGPLLSACKLHSETELAEFAAEKLIELEPKNAGNYVLLSNIYAAAGKWEGVAKMRSFLRGGRLKKTPGISWLDVNGHVHEFRVFDQSHPESGDIYAMLRILEQEIKPHKDLQL